ncbi:MAG: hypothetical protein AAF378_22840 [Cyanobacteria bacterium P01_A01_bin.84]
MFESQIELLNQDYVHNRKVYKIHITENGRQISYTQVLKFWQNNQVFRSLFISLLAKTPFSAFRWETPAIAKATIDNLFEFVLIDSPQLTDKSDPTAFSGHFKNFIQREESIATIANLKKDAFLVVPVPNTLSNNSLSVYAHLAAFSRQAPESQNHALWKTVGETVEKKLEENQSPIWLNTAGAGVPWLHVRLDSRPKYYRFQPYRVLA